MRSPWPEMLEVVDVYALTKDLLNVNGNVTKDLNYTAMRLTKRKQEIGI
jgi:hypothetical protein